MSNLLIFSMKCLNASVPTCFAFHTARQPQSSCYMAAAVLWRMEFSMSELFQCEVHLKHKMCLGVYTVMFEFCIGCVVPFWCFWSSFGSVSISALFGRCCLWISQYLSLSLWCFSKMPPCCFAREMHFKESKARRGCPPQQTTKDTSLPGLGGSPQINQSEVPWQQSKEQPASNLVGRLLYCSNAKRGYQMLILVRENHCTACC